MKAHEGVQLILQQYHHIDPSQKFPEHDAFIDTLATIEGIARIGGLLPVLKGGTLVISPELGARIELGPIVQGLVETGRFPVLSPSQEVLTNMKTESLRKFLLLDGGNVEICWAVNFAFR